MYLIKFYGFMTLYLLSFLLRFIIPFKFQRCRHHHHHRSINHVLAIAVFILCPIIHVLPQPTTIITRYPFQFQLISYLTAFLYLCFSFLSFKL